MGKHYRTGAAAVLAGAVALFCLDTPALAANLTFCGQTTSTAGIDCTGWTVDGLTITGTAFEIDAPEIDEVGLWTVDIVNNTDAPITASFVLASNTASNLEPALASDWYLGLFYNLQWLGSRAAAGDSLDLFGTYSASTPGSVTSGKIDIPEGAAGSVPIVGGVATPLTTLGAGGTLAISIAITNLGPGESYTGLWRGAPEPATWTMMALGFAGLGLIGLRRARAIGLR